MSTNGNEIPPLVLPFGRYLDELYLDRIACSAFVGFWRLVYWPVPPETVGARVHVGQRGGGDLEVAPGAEAGEG